MRQEPSPTHFDLTQAVIGMAWELLGAGLLLAVGLGITLLASVTHGGLR